MIWYSARLPLPSTEICQVDAVDDLNTHFGSVGFSTYLLSFTALQFGYNIQKFMLIIFRTNRGGYLQTIRSSNLRQNSRLSNG